MKRRIYYLAKSLIVAFPQLPRDELRRRHLVGSLDVDSGRGGAGGALSEVLCDGDLCAPFVVAEDAEVAFHILDYENIVGVVDVGSGGGSVRAHAGVNGDKFVELRLAWKLTLRLGGQLRFVGEYVDISPFGIGGESER